MKGINQKGVLVGGLLAGLIFNVGEMILNMGFLAEPMQEMTESHNMRTPTGLDVAIFVVLGFLLGILMIWFYAAVRPRLGPGPGTAALIGAGFWFPAYLIPMVAWIVFGFSSTGMGVLIMLWGLLEMVIAALAGARVYREEGQ